MSAQNVLEYKGYHTRVELDADDMILVGKIEGINDFVNFECENLDEVEKEFHQAVDDYLEFCAEMGKKPEKEYKGAFNVRVDPSLHRQLAQEAMREEMSLNVLVEKALQQYVDNKNIKKESSNSSETIVTTSFKNQRVDSYSKDMMPLNNWGFRV